MRKSANCERLVATRRVHGLCGALTYLSTSLRSGRTAQSYGTICIGKIRASADFHTNLDKTKKFRYMFIVPFRKMRHILLILLIIGIIGISFLLSPSLLSPTGLVIAETEEEELPNFRIYTKAICDNVSDFIICHDELFASCGDFEYRLPKNEVNGNGIFDKNWEDPRNK